MRSSIHLLFLVLVACASSHPAPRRAERSHVTASPSVASSMVPLVPQSAGAAPYESAEPYPKSISKGLTLATWMRHNAPHSIGVAQMFAHHPTTGEALGSVKVERQRVRSVVIGGMARTEVDAVYVNERAISIEGYFEAPLPQLASVSRLALWSNGNWLEGEVFDRDQIYRIPTGKGKSKHWLNTPTLLGAHGGELFQVQIFPIAAKASARVSLTYDEPLQKQIGREVYRYPMSSDDGESLVLGDFSIEVTVFGSANDLGGITTPGYDAQLRREVDRAVVTFHGDARKLKRDFVVVAERLKSTKLEAGVAVPTSNLPVATHPLLARPAADDPSLLEATAQSGYLQVRLLLDLPKETTHSRLYGLNRVLILDKSYGQSQATIDAQSRVVQSIVNSDKPGQNTAVLACDSACVRWEGGTAEHLNAWLRQIAPSGSSDLEGALVEAILALRPGGAGQVVYLGDGMATAGELEPKPLVERISHIVAAGSVDLRLIGIGERIDDAMLAAMAQATAATYDVVTMARSIDEQAFEIAHNLDEPKLTDLQVQLPDGVGDVVPRYWPAFRLGQSLQLVGRVTSPVQGMVRLAGRFLGRPYVQVLPLSISPTSGASNPLLEHYWAQLQVQRRESLLNEHRFEFGVSALARKSRVASRHTAWAALEDARGYESWGLNRAIQSKGNGNLSSGSQSKPERPAGLFPLEPGGVVRDRCKATTVAGWSDQRAALRSLLASTGASISSIEPSEPLALDSTVARSIQRLYQRCLENVGEPGDWVDGWQYGLLRIGSSGRVESFAVEGEDTSTWGSLTGCLRQQAAGQTFEDWPHLSVELRYSANVSTRWERGLRIGCAQQLDGPGLASQSFEPEFDVRIAPGNELWRTPNRERVESTRPQSAGKRERALRALVAGGQFRDAQQLAQRILEIAPQDRIALEILASAAAAQLDTSVSCAASEARLELEPDNDSLRLSLAQAYLGLDDERRACAHLRSIRPKNEELASNVARCRYRWFGEQSTEGAGPPTLPGNSAQAFQVVMSCDPSTIDCPKPIVVTPLGNVASFLLPAPGKGSVSPLAFWPPTDGFYHVMIVGGTRSANGTVEVSVGDQSKQFEFRRGGAMQTIATVGIYESRDHKSTGILGLCQQ